MHLVGQTALFTHRNLRYIQLAAKIVVNTDGMTMYDSSVAPNLAT